MVKVKIDSDEWYPVYTAYEGDKSWGKISDIPRDVLDKYNKVVHDFEDFQVYLSDLYQKAKSKEKLDGLRTVS